MSCKIWNYSMLIVLGLALSTGASPAFAQKGFSKGGASFGGGGGGVSRGGPSISSQGNAMRIQSSTRIQSSAMQSNKLGSSLSNTSRNVSRVGTATGNAGVAKLGTSQFNLGSSAARGSVQTGNLGGIQKKIQIPNKIATPINRGGGGDVIKALPALNGRVGNLAGSQTGKTVTNAVGNAIGNRQSVVGSIGLGNTGKLAGKIGIGASIGNSVGNGSGHAAGHHGKNKGQCKHVIDLLVRNYAHNPKCYTPCIRSYCVDPIWVEVGFLPAPVVVQPVVEQVGVEQPLADLELLAVELVSEATTEAGPVYGVTFRNNSPMDIGTFRISLVAVLGDIDENSPITTVTIDQMAAGETAAVHVQLPVASMIMGAGEQPSPFETLVVAIDSYDELVESNEANNVATFNRSEVVGTVVVGPLEQTGGNEVAANDDDMERAAAVTMTPSGDEAVEESQLDEELLTAPQGQDALANDPWDLDNLDLGDLGAVRN